MAFVVRDFYEANQPVPADTQPPPGGSPLYSFIVKRLMDSFNLPLGITRYIELMQPAFPDVGLGFGLMGGRFGDGEFLYVPQPPLGNCGAGALPTAVHWTHNTLPPLPSATIPRAPMIPFLPAV